MKRKVIGVSECSWFIYSAVPLYVYACFASRLREGLAEVVRMMQLCTGIPAAVPAGTGYHSLAGEAEAGKGTGDSVVTAGHFGQMCFLSSQELCLT